MKMQARLTTEASPVYWGDNAPLSIDGATVTIHVKDYTDLLAIQKAGRRIDNQGIKAIKLIGAEWGVEQVWHFWQGYRHPKKINQLDYSVLSADDQQTISQRLTIVDWVRDTINAPAAELSPLQLAQNALTLLQSVSKQKLTHRLLQGEQLAQQNYVGIYNVGKGSQRPPVLLSVDYNPTGKADAPVFASLVGKGITFDSGGYSLKASQMMDSMKSDMGGAALITGALALAIDQGLKKRVKLYLCCADNLVSGEAFKLGDILHYRNGKTVEVMNTDAEGRLVLADGLIDASADQASLLIDCATLTGAAKMAVGNDYHSVLSFDDQLVNQLLHSAQQQQELFWRLPLAEFHRQQLPANFADLNNISAPAHTAGASTAAAFLSHFVTGYQQGWLHIDCSATYRKSAVAQWAAGATGIGVRTLADLLLNYTPAAVEKS